MNSKGSARVRVVRISRISHEKLQMRNAVLYMRELERWNRRSFPVAF